MAHIHEQIDFVVNAFLVHDRKVLLVDHRELGQWLPPGGHVELDEDTDRAIYREIKEETGLRADEVEILSEKPVLQGAKSPWPPRWLNIHRINDRHRHLALIYVFRAKSGNARLLEREHHSIRWFSPGELAEPGLRIPPDVRWYAEEVIRLVP